jgi:hypothetical protein
MMIVWDQRTRGKLVLFRDAGNESRHLISAPAGARGNDKFNGLGRFPRRGVQGEKKELRYDREENMESEFHFGPSFSILGSRLSLVPVQRKWYWPILCQTNGLLPDKWRRNICGSERRQQLAEGI